MSYRDDQDALLARADALEDELERERKRAAARDAAARVAEDRIAELEREKDELRQRLTSSAASSAPNPPRRPDAPDPPDAPVFDKRTMWLITAVLIAGIIAFAWFAADRTQTSADHDLRSYDPGQVDQSLRNDCAVLLADPDPDVRATARYLCITDAGAAPARRPPP